MLLRVRVTLPDRPGSLGQVARTLGVCGADIVQVLVLERRSSRAVDDITMIWPGAARVERLLTSLGELPGVRVDGLWQVTGAPVGDGYDAQLLAQLADNPDDGLATMVDAVPGLLAADWAAAVAVPADWPVRDRDPSLAPVGRAATSARGCLVVKASWQLADPILVPEVSPVRAKPMAGPGGARYAVAPFARAGLVLVAARVHGDPLPPASFHRTEVDRLAQLVGAAAAVLGDRLDRTVDRGAVGPAVLETAPGAVGR